VAADLRGMSDLAMVAATVAFFLAAWRYARACERL
jgi:hypothetical protein